MGRYKFQRIFCVKKFCFTARLGEQALEVLMLLGVRKHGIPWLILQTLTQKQLTVSVGAQRKDGDVVAPGDYVQRASANRTGGSKYR